MEKNGLGPLEQFLNQAIGLDQELQWRRAELYDLESRLDALKREIRKLRDSMDLREFLLRARPENLDVTSTKASLYVDKKKTLPELRSRARPFQKAIRLKTRILSRLEEGEEVPESWLENEHYYNRKGG